MPDCFYLCHEILDGNIEFLETHMNHPKFNDILGMTFQNNYIRLSMWLLRSGKFDSTKFSVNNLEILIKNPKLIDNYEYIISHHESYIQNLTTKNKLRLFNWLVVYKYPVLALELIQKYRFQIGNCHLEKLIDNGFAKVVNYICSQPHLRPTNIPYDTRNKLVVLNQSMKFIENNISVAAIDMTNAVTK